jgi:hypothetical protein
MMSMLLIEGDHPIETQLSYILSSNPTFLTPLISLRLYGDLGRSKWSIDLRKTLGALSLTDPPGAAILGFQQHL